MSWSPDSQKREGLPEEPYQYRPWKLTLTRRSEGIRRKRIHLLQLGAQGQIAHSIWNPTHQTGKPLLLQDTRSALSTPILVCVETARSPDTSQRFLSDVNLTRPR